MLIPSILQHVETIPADAGSTYGAPGHVPEAHKGALQPYQHQPPPQHQQQYYGAHQPVQPYEHQQAGGVVHAAPQAPPKKWSTPGSFKNTLAHSAVAGGAFGGASAAASSLVHAILWVLVKWHLFKSSAVLTSRSLQLRGVGDTPSLILVTMDTAAAASLEPLSLVRKAPFVVLQPVSLHLLAMPSYTVWQEVLRLPNNLVYGTLLPARCTDETALACVPAWDGQPLHLQYLLLLSWNSPIIPAPSSESSRWPWSRAREVPVVRCRHRAGPALSHVFQPDSGICA